MNTKKQTPKRKNVNFASQEDAKKVGLKTTKQKRVKKPSIYDEIADDEYDMDYDSNDDYNEYEYDYDKDDNDDYY